LQSTIVHSSAKASLSSLLSFQSDSTDDPWQDIVSDVVVFNELLDLIAEDRSKGKEKTLALKKQASRQSQK
jgi:hypothetical protein